MTREQLRAASPAERVAYLVETLKMLDAIEDRLVSDFEPRCDVVDDIWTDLAPEGVPGTDGDPTTDPLLNKVLAIGGVVHGGWFQGFPRHHEGNTVHLLEISDAELAEIERRLTEVKS